MARSKNYIEIEGIFATEVLGMFSIIRGFASLQDLAAISVPVLMDPPAADGRVHGFQRQIDEEHAAEVKKYFEEGDRRFIPEVILSLRADTTREMDGPYQIGASYSAPGLSLRRKHSSRNLRIHTLRIEQARLEELKQQTRIRRIDGNHRLAKAHELPLVLGESNKYKVPFSLLLLREPGDVADDYNEALIFHTINSTAKPLDGEQALQLILGQEHGFTMGAEKEFSFAPALHLTRLLDMRLRNLPEPLRTRLGRRPLHRLSVAAKELLRSFPNQTNTLEQTRSFTENLVGALTDLATHLYIDFPDFVAADYFIELAAHAWMRTARLLTHESRVTSCRAYLMNMSGWMGNDGLRGLNAARPLGRQLLDIYDAICRRVPKKVFLARWYPKPTDGDERVRANNRLTAIRNVVEDELGLELRDLGTEEGGTHLIHPALYDAIGSSDIVIADMTGLRQNVLLETGYAIHHHTTKRLILLFNPIAGAERMPFDTSSFLYREIHEAADIPAAIRGDLEEILRAARGGEI